MSASANFVTSGQLRYLRACMVCSVVMTYSVSSLPRLYENPPARADIKTKETRKRRREKGARNRNCAGVTGNEFVLMERKRQRFRDEGCPNC